MVILSIDYLIIKIRFSSLSVEERINSLTTISPSLTGTFLNMNNKIQQNGKHHSFALKIGQDP